MKLARAFILIVDGKIIAERYRHPFNSRVPLLGWSMNKSLLSALIGIRIKQGKLSLKEKLNVTFWSDEEKHKIHKRITIDSLLRMSSGLKFDETYGVFGDSLKMLFTSTDSAKVAYDQEVEFDPDTNWSYSSGTTNILSKILRDSFDNNEDYWRFPKEELFDKIGANSFELETDTTGTFVLSSFGYASPRDWARLGLLYAQDGIWNGEKIFPDNWVNYTTTPTPCYEFGHYGAQWWLNVGYPNGTKPLPSLPSDLYFASGFETQYIVVIPSKKVIIVRMGLTRGDTRDMSLKEINMYVTRVLDSIPT